MHITDLHIDRFGVWRDLTLPLSGPGLNVLYGPNEAGKSTLMRFAKAVLYGGDAVRADAGRIESGRLAAPRLLRHETSFEALHGVHDGGPHGAGGSLRVMHHGRPFTIRRSLSPGGEDRVHVVGPDESPVPPGWLDDLLGGTSEAVFDRVFAVDLYELQELATLDHDELAEHVYGLSLGLRGRRLVAAADDLRTQRRALLSDDGRGGRMARLLDRERALLGRLGELPDLPAVHAEFSGRRDALDQEVNGLRRRRADIQHETRGRRYMERVWSPWKQVAEYRADLTRRDGIADLPADGLEQIDALERQADSHARRRDDRLAEAEDRGRKLHALGREPEILRHEPAVRAMVGLRGWLKETAAARQSADESRRRAAEQAKRAAAALGPGWTEQKLAAIDVSPQAQVALVNAARAYRTAIGRRSDVRRKYKRTQQLAAKREALLVERLGALDGQTPDEAAAAVRRRIAELEQLGELRAKEAAYEHRGKNLRQRLDQLTDSLEVPPWVSFVLAVFALGGAGFAVAGLVTGVTTSALAGAIYLLLGLTCGSMAVKLRQHFEAALHETTERVRDERRSEEVELRKVREQIARLLAGPADAPVRPRSSFKTATTAGPTSVELLREELRRLADLDDLVRRQQLARGRRRLLTKLRDRMRRVQQNVDAARQDWCETLVKLGLAETLDLEAALAGWQQVAQAGAVRAAVGVADREYALLDASLRAVGTQLDALGKRMHAKSGDPQRPLELLAAWEKELDAALAQGKERQRLTEDRDRAAAQAADADEKAQAVGRQRTALFAAAGVADRAAYVKRLRSADERRELEDLLLMAEAELESAAASDTELAIVEEDLRAFRPDENAAALKRLTQEQQRIDAELEAALERRGHVARRLDELEADGSAAALRRDRGRIDAQLRRTAEKLLALAVAERATEAARVRFEQDHQPPVLAAASESLARLTAGRYRRVFAPPGTRTLRVEDAHGGTLGVEQLSGGTREQVFLAVRLGLVRHAADRGVRLPLILDDVLVNFDQQRTDAAFETLRDFAAEGRQILFFTCHLHLAQMAEGRGVPPIWLPGHAGPVPQRLAG